VANLILAFKDRGRTALAPYLARKLLGPLSNFNRAGVQLAALPTSRSALARRGFDAGAFLVRALAKESGFPVSNSLLSLERQPADQRSLAAGQRAANLFESMSAKPGGGRILIVDDIVTTGASLLEARRALVAAGFEVAGFVTVAETLLQKSTNLPKEAAPIL
jgi:predicted amidophosphoribosyltransferase